MTAGQIFKVVGAASVAVGGLFIWVVAGVSALAGDGAALWVTLGAAFVMAGMGLGFVVLHPRRARVE